MPWKKTKLPQSPSGHRSQVEPYGQYTMYQIMQYIQAAVGIFWSGFSLLQYDIDQVLSWHYHSGSRSNIGHIISKINFQSSEVKVQKTKVSNHR